MAAAERRTGALTAVARPRAGERAQLAAEIVLAYLRAAPRAAAGPDRRRRRAAARGGHPAAPAPAAPGAGGSAAPRLAPWSRILTPRCPATPAACAARWSCTQLLARRGIPARLVIGARAGPDFLAHAWVEHDGVPVLSPGDGSFGRLVEL